MDYLVYNREERDLCSHLFRLLLEDQPNWGPLKQFLGESFYGSPRVFSEVAIIRDAYSVRKPDTELFLVELCKFIAKQKGLTESDYTNYPELPEVFRDPEKTHPKQIHSKLKKAGLIRFEGDQNVYITLQAMFNAKPDLVVCVDDKLFIYEAKYKSLFDEEQMARTSSIGHLWASLLYKDLGFTNVPEVVLRKLGLASSCPDVSWQDVYEMAKKVLGEQDYSTKVLSKVLIG
jgi:hypothetical protein